MEKSVERAALASLSSRAPGGGLDEAKRLGELNFTLALERPVALDASVSDAEWKHFQRIVHFYVDFRLKKVCGCVCVYVTDECVCFATVCVCCMCAFMCACVYGCVYA